ncbi:hypothetical protein Btru_046770, partial [Bulinus truncatus]
MIQKLGTAWLKFYNEFAKDIKILPLLLVHSNFVSKYLHHLHITRQCSYRHYSTSDAHHKALAKNYSSFTKKADIQNLKSVTVSSNGKTCNIKWNDDSQSEFHSIWLRQNCHCESCRHPNGQRLLVPTSVPTSTYLDNLSTEGNYLKFSWSSAFGQHQGVIPIGFLRNNSYDKTSMTIKRQAVKCGNPCLEIPSISFSEVTSSPLGILKMLQQINEEGLTILKDVPIQDSVVVEVANLIGPVKATIYGTTFDVEVTSDPINVAYSNLEIDLHQDLVYYESPPGLQLLHCLKFDDCVKGGESIFLDVFYVADQFRINYPHLFKVLTEVPATFQKVHYSRDYPVHIMNQKPHIRLNHLGEVVAVYWAPPFEGPLSVAEEFVEQYYDAYEMFANTIKSSSKL